MSFPRRAVPLPPDRTLFVRPKPDFSPVFLPDDVFVPDAADVFLREYFWRLLPDELNPAPEAEDF